MNSKLTFLILLAISRFASAEPLAGMGYECLEAKVDPEQALKTRAPYNTQGLELVSWFETNRNVSSRIKGRLIFVEGAGSSDNGKLRLDAWGSSFPDGSALLNGNIKYALGTANAPSFISYAFNCSPKGNGVCASIQSNGGENKDIELLCSFAPIQK